MPQRCRISTIRSTLRRIRCRWLGRLRDWEGIGFVDHTRRAKRRGLNIRNRRGKKRLDGYRDLIKVASKTAHYLELLHKVIEQTQRRVLSGEAVAAQEKICSIFEEHTDIIKKSPRETRTSSRRSTGRRSLGPVSCQKVWVDGREQSASPGHPAWELDPSSSGHRRRCQALPPGAENPSVVRDPSP